MSALLMGSEITLRTLSAVLFAKWQHVTAVAAPIGTNIGELLEAMRNAMVDLLLVWIGFCIRLTYTLRNHTGIALGVASILAVLALHAGGVFEEVTAECAAHDVVELLGHKLVTIHLVNKLLALTDSTLTIETKIEWSTVLGLLDKAQRELDLTCWFEIEPCLNWLRWNGWLCCWATAGVEPSSSRARRSTERLRR